MIEEVYNYFEYASLILALFFYNKYKRYPFYNFFIIYLVNIIVFNILAKTLFKLENHNLFNIYTFFEFNLFTLIYYNLLKDKEPLKLLKILAITFNIFYFISFLFLDLQKYTVIVEGVINSVFIILFFRELLNSERILNYKKLLSFWVSVGFLLFYLTSIPCFALIYFDFFIKKIDFPLLPSLIILLHLCLIYGLVTCKKIVN